MALSIGWSRGPAFLASLSMAIATASAAQALPQCQPATPEVVGVVGQYAQNTWKNYRTLPAEHRCCARPCEPLGRFAGKLEINAVALNAIARNPKVPKTERDAALINANKLFKLRNDTAFQFLQCQVQTRPTGTGAAARCGQVLIPARTIGWARWCDAFATRMQGFRDLLISTVGNNVGSWRVESGYFRIQNDGTIDADSVRIEGSPDTRLPANTSTQPFKSAIINAKPELPGFPVIAAVQRRMYMRFVATAYRPAGPAGTKALDTSLLFDGVCPGPVDRPAN